MNRPAPQYTPLFALLLVGSACSPGTNEEVSDPKFALSCPDNFSVVVWSENDCPPGWEFENSVCWSCVAEQACEDLEASTPPWGEGTAGLCPPDSSLVVDHIGDVDMCMPRRGDSGDDTEQAYTTPTCDGATPIARAVPGPDCFAQPDCGDGEYEPHSMTCLICTDQEQCIEECTLALTACLREAEDCDGIHTEDTLCFSDCEQEFEQCSEHCELCTSDPLPQPVTRDLDILFVVDNSQSMVEEQAALASRFHDFVGKLNELEDGLPNIHLGVVSTDMGGGPYCSASGDDGSLQATPQVSGCSGPSGNYIVDIDDGAGGRIRNYTGELAETFSCIGQLGDDGCGIEMPLAAMQKALDGSNPANAGFLREDAYLAVVFITDEDDCSSNAALWDLDETVLGPLSGFRCWEYGVQCQPDSDPRAPGPRTQCQPRHQSPYAHNVNGYIDFLSSLKSDPRKLLVANIRGNAGPVEIVELPDSPPRPQVAPSCQSSIGDAIPATRLDYFAQGFPLRHRLTSICDDDISGALTDIANLLGDAIENPDDCPDDYVPSDNTADDDSM